MGIFSWSAEVATLYVSDLTEGYDGQKNHYKLYDSKPLMFGISESPLIVDNMVIASPGGKKASMVAFNINDGNVVWEAESKNQETTICKSETY